MMKKLTLLPVILTLLAAGAAQAQEREEVSVQDLLAYESEKKSEAVALMLELVLPTLGHVYAGDFKRGVIPALVSVGGMAAWMIGAVGSAFNSNDADNWMRFGAIAAIGGRVWGLVTAPGTAKQFNERLRQKLGIETTSISVGPHGLQLALSVPAGS